MNATDRHAALRRARLYLIVSPEALGADWDERAAAALTSGAVDMLQLRAKTWEDERIRAEALRLGAWCREVGALFLLNDRPDLAAQTDADGVHVGADDGSVAEARAQVGGDRIVGCSTHDTLELQAVGDADYAGLGPCFPTESKSLTLVPGGAALLRAALPAAPVGLPVFPIGGIDGDNLPELIGAGATRAAVGAGVLAQTDPAEAARTLRRLLQSRSTPR